MTTTAPISYLVPAISCEHCKRAIEIEVGAVAGVTAVDVDVDAKTVQVEGTATDAEVRAAVARAGYEVGSETAE